MPQQILHNMEDRLSRMRLMVGDTGLEKLRNSHVVVVGCGAVGSYAIEALARGGIGHLTLVDFDSIHPSNINRQLFALHSTLNEKKVKVAQRRIRDIAPDMKIDTLDILINADTVEQVIDLKPDFVIDAIDSLNPKVCLIEALQKNHIPFVSSMGAALKTKAEQIKVTKMNKTKNCPLAAFVRKYLRRRDIPLDFWVVASEELTQDKSKLHLPDEVPESGRIRHEMGSFPTITGIFGLMCAQKTFDELLK